MGYEKTEMKMKMAAKRYRCMGKATATPIISRFSYANDLWMAKICRGKYYIFGKYCRYIAQQECVFMCITKGSNSRRDRGGGCDLVKQKSNGATKTPYIIVLNTKIM